MGVRTLYRTVLLTFLLVILVPAIAPSKAGTNKLMIDYVLDYLKVFPNLEFADVMSTMIRESGGNVKCKTWEPTVSEYSYGPLQILGSTARLKGYKGALDELCSWKDGLYYGMSYLSDCKHRAINIVAKDPLVKLMTTEQKERKIRAHMHAMYNTGRIMWKKGHEGIKYTNHDYVVECEYLYWRYKKFDYEGNTINTLSSPIKVNYMVK